MQASEVCSSVRFCRCCQVEAGGNNGSSSYPYEYDPERQGATGDDSRSPDLFWDLFIEKCVLECSKLIAVGWIGKEDVESADPSVILSVPAIAVLAVLADTVNSGSRDKSEILWKEAGVTCNDSTRPK